MTAESAAPSSLAKPEPARLLGAAAALLTVTFWAVGLVATRFGVTGSLTLYDVVFLRLLMPAVLLLPVLLRHGTGLRGAAGTRPGILTVMVIGAGLPFMLVSSTGMLFAPAAHAGVLMPGCMPLFAALLAYLLLGDRFDAGRKAGIALMLVGALAVGGYQVIGGGNGAWRGDLLFLAAGAMWACYTIAMKKSGLGHWHAVAIIFATSVLLYTPVYLLWLDSRLMTAPLFEIAVQLLQSVASGLLSTVAYGFAVRRLGATGAAAFGALTPALTALLAIPLLGEWPDLVTWIGIVAVSLGVALANGVFSRYRLSNQ